MKRHIPIAIAALLAGASVAAYVLIGGDSVRMDLSGVQNTQPQQPTTPAYSTRPSQNPGEPAPQEPAAGHPATDIASQAPAPYTFSRTGIPIVQNDIPREQTATTDPERHAAFARAMAADRADRIRPQRNSPISTTGHSADTGSGTIAALHLATTTRATAAPSASPTGNQANSTTTPPNTPAITEPAPGFIAFTGQQPPARQTLPPGQTLQPHTLTRQAASPQPTSLKLANRPPAPRPFTYEEELFRAQYGWAAFANEHFEAATGQPAPGTAEPKAGAGQ